MIDKHLLYHKEGVGSLETHLAWEKLSLVALESDRADKVYQDHMETTSEMHVLQIEESSRGIRIPDLSFQTTHRTNKR